MQDLIYRLADGRLWDVRAARFMDTASPTVISDLGQNPKISEDNVVDLISAEGRSDLSYLIQTLEHGGYPLGELASFSPRTIKGELARLDAEWLTPRTLAGLSTGDSEAVSRWQEHERLAAPLRAKLAELAN